MDRSSSNVRVYLLMGISLLSQWRAYLALGKETGSLVCPPLSLADPHLVPEVSQYLWMHLGGSDSQYDDKVLWLATVAEANLLRANYRLGNKEGKTYFPPVHFRAVFHCPRVLRAQRGAAQKTWLGPTVLSTWSFKRLGNCSCHWKLYEKWSMWRQDKN